MRLLPFSGKTASVLEPVGDQMVVTRAWQARVHERTVLMLGTGPPRPNRGGMFPEATAHTDLIA